MNKIRLTFVAILLSINCYSQIDSSICGYQSLIAQITKNNPHFSDSIIAIKHQYQRILNDFKEGKTEASKSSFTQSAIPIIFHIILSHAQYDQLGGENGVVERIDSQLVVINRDFNCQNPDTILVPQPFKKMIGQTGIKFGLAHTSPNGKASLGYEVIFTDNNGIELSNGYGSGIAFSSAKYNSSGGADSWDVSSYLNVWIINPINNGIETNIVGLTVPQLFTGIATGISDNEMGVCLNYRAFGVKNTNNPLFIQGKDKGRTLTHELGHFFQIYHPWGDDNGLCEYNGGQDDGISDTPPQANATYHCPSFPKYDACSLALPGIMYMNYMDYTDDECLHLFTQEQSLVMQRQISYGQSSYSLTLHPRLLDYPDNLKSEVSIYPNPANSIINVLFSGVQTKLQSIKVINSVGQTVENRTIDGIARSFYSISIQEYSHGLYSIILYFEDHSIVEKVVIQ